MPEIIYNRLNVSGLRSESKKLLDAVRGDKYEIGEGILGIDFSKVISIPKDVHTLDIPYWCDEHWGTKQNASDVVIIDGEDDYTILFKSEDYSPTAVVETLSDRFPLLHLQLAYVNEGLDFANIVRYTRGDELFRDELSSGAAKFLLEQINNEYNESYNQWVEVTSNGDLLDVDDGMEPISDKASNKSFSKRGGIDLD